MKEPAPGSNKPAQSPEEALAIAEQKLVAIDQNIEFLREKARKAREDREIYVRGKIVNLEELTKRGDEIQRLEKAAKKTLAELTPLQNDPALKGDPELARQLAQAQELLTGLEVQAREVFEEIGKIGAQTEITSKIDEDDAAERKELQLRQAAAKTKVEYEAKIRKEFAQEAEKFATELEKYTAELDAWYTENDRLKEESQKAHQEVKEVIGNALKMLGSEDTNEKAKVRGAIKRLESESVLKEKDKIEKALLELQNIKKSLGHWWGGDKREKAIIDFVILKQHLFKVFQEAFIKANTSQGGERFGQQQARLVEEFKRIQQKYSSIPGLDLDLRSTVSSLYKDGRGEGKHVNPKDELITIYNDVRYKR